MEAPNHNIIVIDNAGDVKSVKPTTDQLQALIDTEDYVIIDPLNHQAIKDDGEWGAIETGQIISDSSIVMVR